MLCSIVHKIMGKKWEAILAQIFVVGGRFPPYPAMVRRMSDKMANLLNGQGHEMHGPRPPRRGPWLRLWQRGEVEVR